MNLPYSKNVILNVMNLKHSLGKTAIMKITYMLQQIKKIDLGYSFEIYTYGPYTAEVTEDINDLIQSGLIHSSMYNYSNYIGYELKLSKKGKDSLNTLNTKEILNINEIIDFIEGKNAKNLELSSTIVFINGLYLKNKLPYNQDVIINKVHEIKPHFEIDSIRDSYNELKERKYLNVDRKR